MKALNKQTAPKSVAPEKIIQFGEGNFLRAFVDWIIWNMNKKTDFNASVVVVQPIERGMVEWLNGQDCLYHVNLQGRQNGKPVDTLDRVDVISRALNPYSQNAAFMALADQPEIRFVISNTTEAGIAFDPACKLSDAPASSYPGKLVQLLYRRYQTFNGCPSKGLIIMPCELIFLNGHHLRSASRSTSSFGRMTSVLTMKDSRSGLKSTTMFALPSWTVSFPDSPARKLPTSSRRSLTLTTLLYRQKSSISG